MNLRCLPLVLALMTVAPMAVQAQRMPNPQEMPAPDLKKIPPIKMGTTISGTITVKDPQQLKNLNQLGSPKCSLMQVMLSDSDPNQPKQSKFPGESFAPVKVNMTGNHLGLGCNYSLTVPDNAQGKKGYLSVLYFGGGPIIDEVPDGWQNPLSVPSTGNVERNFLVMRVYKLH
jgi:hypothetical protein